MSVVWQACGPAIAVCMALSAAGVQAQTCSASMTPVAFANVSPVAGTIFSAQGTLTVQCTWPAISLATARVCVNLGAGSTSSTQDPRQMGNGTNRLSYRLASNTALSPLWGSTATGTTPITLTLSKPLVGTSASQNVTIYGRVMAAQYTVPTVNNAATIYTEQFTAASATVNFGFYTLAAPACSTLPVGGTFAFNVTANVINSCTITAQPLSFGSAGLLPTALNADTTVTVRCTNNDAYRIKLDGGQNGTVAQRRLLRSGGSNTLLYSLYTDAARTRPWGDGTAGTGVYLDTGTGNMQDVAVYGSVLAQSAGIPGSYSDQVTATVEF